MYCSDPVWLSVDHALEVDILFLTFSFLTSNFMHFLEPFHFTFLFYRELIPSSLLNQISPPPPSPLSNMLQINMLSGDGIEDLQQIMSILEQGCALRKNTREPMVSA